MLAPDYRARLVSLLIVLQRKNFSGRANAVLPLPFFLWPFAFFLKRRRKYAHIYLDHGRPYAYQIWQNGKLISENAPVVRLLLRVGKRLSWYTQFQYPQSSQYPPAESGMESQYPPFQSPPPLFQYPPTEPEKQILFRSQAVSREELMSWGHRERQIYCLANGSRSLEHILRILCVPYAYHSHYFQVLQSFQHSPTKFKPPSNDRI
ncbi:hypothetical protein EPA93_34260 [Ktedonosporobacter rubrisoli]|uniref:Uncharacterized protein n=1 Tax=Ktedonosporobacter rubrisoli TaxID=2509675 RepID=A0A4P6JZ36_KTERU|nr:hypothetical protein [Ktedonosporobacter rubrisoli]QBD80762.1 hypothetical protein EPA93_34260 [Ktedonosporobacter rubrisoli]